uniref:F-box domain-containing protein n=1 Tax=Alexandrium monilatum TaxID=311494 RepID=A0A7S4PSP9_9DINO
MARGRAQAPAASVTLLDFFARSPRLSSAAAEEGAAAGNSAAALPEARTAIGVLRSLPNEVVSLIWAFSGPRRCCAVRQVSAALVKLCPCDHTALKRALCLWALTVVDMAALRPTGDNKAGPNGGPGTASKLGRWGDFTAVTDGAGQGFVRGPALLRCTQRWRLRARAAQLRNSSTALSADDSHTDVPLHEALRCSAAHALVGEVSAALAGVDGPGGAGVGLDRSPSIHLSGSIWDAIEERPAKRRRVGEVPSDVVGAAAGVDGTVSGFFAVRRWDALMDSRVPWRLRAAALVFHHHCARGCAHAGVRKAAADFIQSRTRHDERLRSSLLDPVDH